MAAVTRRWRGLVGLAAAVTSAELFGRWSRQLWLTVAGIALPVALLVIVTSVSTGLAAGATVQNPAVDYWIVPEAAGSSSAVVAVGGPQFGDVHATSARLSGDPDIEHVSPVLQSLVRVRAADGESQFVLAVGVLPRATPDRYAGVSTAGLTPGDPYFANGTYGGSWTGQAVLSSGAAELLGVDRGAAVTLASRRTESRSFTVVNVSEGGATGAGELPVMLVHLSELQVVTGADAGDRADQLLVATSTRGVRDRLAAVYPRSEVLTRTGLATRQVLDSSLPRALALGALAVAVIVGVLFAASTMGLAVAAKGRTRAVLAAVGVSARSRAVLVATEILVLALLGGGLGVGLGGLGAAAINLSAAWAGAPTPVAVFRPVFVAYGLGVAVVIGLVTVPYLVVIGRRTTRIADLAA